MHSKCLLSTNAAARQSPQLEAEFLLITHARSIHLQEALNLERVSYPTTRFAESVGFIFLTLDHLGVVIVQAEKTLKKQSGIPPHNCSAGVLRDVKQIMHMLPHRYPFQMVDKVVHLDARSVTGIKNVTINEPFFQGHFPGNPIMPGVLQLEALAQTGGVLVLSTVPDPENYLTYFLSIDQCRFRRTVRPGDTLVLHGELVADIKRGIAKMKGRVFVDNYLTCEAIIMAQIVKQPQPDLQRPAGCAD